MPYSSTKQVSNIGGSTNQTQNNSHGQHLVPVAASHQLSQIDFYFISIPPHGSGAFPGAPTVSSFLSSSLRPPVRAPGKRTVMVLLSFRWASGHPNGWSAW